MAQRATTLTNPAQHIGRVMVLATTTGLLNGDTSAPVEAAQYDALSVQVIGTFGAGGSVAVEGSHDDVAYFALKSAGIGGTTIAITSAGGSTVVARGVRFVRVRVTAGDGTTNLTASLFLRK